MSNVHALKTIHADEPLTACMYDDAVLVLLWKRPINLALVQPLEATLADVARQRTKPAALLSVVTPEAQASFEGSARQLNLQLLHCYQSILTTAGRVEAGVLMEITGKKRDRSLAYQR